MSMIVRSRSRLLRMTTLLSLSRSKTWSVRKRRSSSWSARREDWRSASRVWREILAGYYDDLYATGTSAPAFVTSPDLTKSDIRYYTTSPHTSSPCHSWVTVWTSICVVARLKSIIAPWWCLRVVVIQHTHMDLADRRGIVCPRKWAACGCTAHTALLTALSIPGISEADHRAQRSSQT